MVRWCLGCEENWVMLGVVGMRTSLHSSIYQDYIQSWDRGTIIAKDSNDWVIISKIL